MLVEMEYDQLEEALDGRKYEVIQELAHRLQREMQLYAALTQGIAYAASQEVTRQLGLEGPEEQPNGQTPLMTTAQTLYVQRRKVMEAMRQSLYHATNKLKNLSNQGKAAFAQHRAETAPVPAEA